MTTQVVHVDSHVFGAVYIGRAVPRRGYRKSKWANPYKIGWDGSRAEVIEKYHNYVLHQPALMASLHELKNRPLACWCAPKGESLPGNIHGTLCHGEILAALADALEQDGAR